MRDGTAGLNSWKPNFFYSVLFSRKQHGIGSEAARVFLGTDSDAHWNVII
jgi:hypothetical protein